MGPRPLPRLHAVTDDEVLARGGFVDAARRALAAGGRRLALQLRGRATSGARMHELASALAPAARASGALLIANERVDLALVAGLDGVHLPGRSLPPDVARRLLPPGRWVGASVHDEAEARAAAEQADYLVVGTVFATPSHPGLRGAGTELLARVAAVAPLPLIAIGGVTPERTSEVIAAGAAGVAVLSGIWGAPDPEVAVVEYLRCLPQGAVAAEPRLVRERAGKD